MTKDAERFHRRTARELTERYARAENPPDGWRETASWHWAQGGAFAEAADDAIEVAETRIERLDFVAARRWAERTLEYLERLTPIEKLAYELRAFAVALAVLEFGGQYREGLDYASRMLRSAQALRNRTAEAQALLAQGRMLRELNQLPQAETTLQEARLLAEAADESELEADIRLHLAKVHQLQGRHLEALQELELAHNEHVLADDQAKIARVFTGMGDIYRVLGANREALGFYNRALTLEQSRGNLLGQAMLQDKMALALLSLQRFAEAEGSERESLRLRTMFGDVIGQARSNSVLGKIAQQVGQYERAIEFSERAQALEVQTQNQRGQHVALLQIGDAYVSLGRFNDANDVYSRARELAQQRSDKVALVRTLERQGDMWATMGRRDVATVAWSEALRIREQLGHADEAAHLRELLKGEN